MLVVLSDLHLTDGTLSQTLAPGAFELFLRRLEELAQAASWRADGSYRPIEAIDLLLLGDILDPMRSARWLGRGKVRPWGNPHAPELVDQVARITADILELNAESLAVLRALGREEGLRVPPALKAARPAADTEGQPVPVRIHYMVGNHDWFYHLPGTGYDAVRKLIVDRIGLANPADEPFPHEMTESEPLLAVLRRHRVCARHGDVFDPLSFDGDRDTSSLGDAILLELVLRFVAEVEATLGHELPPATLLGLRETDQFRPLPMLPVWIAALLERTCPAPALRKRVMTAWDRLADELLQIDFVRRGQTGSRLDFIDGLHQALKFSQRPPGDWAQATSQWLARIRGAPDGSYRPHAAAEQDFRNRRAKHIVYGHTHLAEAVPLDASYAESYVLEQMYFNVGTWQRVHRPTCLAPQGQEFIAWQSLSMIVFYQADERRGRSFEMWSAMLGDLPVQAAIHRLDAGREALLAPKHLSGADSAPRAPHFVARPPQPASRTTRPASKPRA